MVAGYNVQIAVDDRHKLIVASEVVNDGNDSGQLHEVAVAAKKALGVETLRAVADGGYYNGDTLRACEADDIVAFVPEANKNNRLAKQGRFTLKDFAYGMSAASCMLLFCPPPQSVAASSTALRCLTDARRREVHRWQHQDVIVGIARMAGADAAVMMRRRAALAEHPFGTLKCRAGYRHFLLRGFHRYAANGA